jgi:quinol monooxygenase YgiN
MKPAVIRLVKMTFHPERIDDFERMFDERSSQIRNFEGCRQLDLVRDTRHPNVMMTISVWASDDALARYRESDLFLETWTITKKMFADRPEAASYERIRTVGSESEFETG